MMQQQQPYHPMQTLMGSAFPPIASATTEIVQTYLDENKQLILAILDNQTLGKINESAIYKAKLQANLMYLAAVADSQPYPSPVHVQVQPTTVLQPGTQYMTHSQVQQQMAQRSLMVGRISLQYTPQQILALHQAQQQLQQQQQQSMHGQIGINPVGNNELQMNSTESGKAVNNHIAPRGFPDFGHGEIIGEGMQVNSAVAGEMRTGGRSDISVVSDMGGHLRTGNVNEVSGLEQRVDELGSYLRATHEGRK